MNTPTFLEELAEKLYDRHGKYISELTLIFPNKRAGLFFRKYLAQKIAQPIWSPQIMSIEAFVQQHSGLQQADSLTLVFELYQVFQRLHPNNESFERFYGWGIMLLKDFSEIDQYLVNATQLFTNLSEQKALEQTFDYLTEEQQATIRAFWKSFDRRLSAHQHSFLQLWSVLPKVYQQFRENLLTQKMGYTGLHYQVVCDKLATSTIKADAQHLVFAGFNALAPAEEKILSLFKAHTPTTFYWDVDAYYMEDPKQEAGYYLRAYRHKQPFIESFPKPFPKQLQDASKNIALVGVASRVGQAHVVGERLQAMLQTQGDQFVAEKTAIVLADEGLLFPVLHAIPPSMGKINVTMGYPLQASPLYNLIELLFKMQLEVHEEAHPKAYLPAQQVVAILSHPYVRNANEGLAQQIINHIHQEKELYVAQRAITEKHTLYTTIFKLLSKEEDILPYFINCLLTIKAYLPEEGTSLLFEKEILYHFYKECSRLKAIFGVHKGKFVLKAFAPLFRQLIQQMRIPFKGEPLEGIQVMGVLETRNLDFDNLFILSMNEGTFPAQAHQPSFIPYNLRKGYGLPTFDQHQASIYAYHFYRLLQRAKNIMITYNAQASAEGEGEMSRYLWQLVYESDLPIKQSFIANPVHIPKTYPIIIQKKEEVLQQLAKYLVKNGQAQRRLTPSALNTYLECSLRFYFTYLVKLQRPEKLQQEVGAMLLGSLLHRTMEKLYTPFLQEEKTIQKQAIAHLRNRLVQVIQEVFTKQPFLLLHGQNVVVQAVIKKLAQRILQLDGMYAPFTIVGLEVGRTHPLYLDYQFGHTHTVRLTGIIDRVDRKDDTIRVLDYKTGADERRIESISSLFDKNMPQRNKAALQTLFYAWLFRENYETYASDKIVPGMMNSKEIFEENFDPRFLIKRQRSPLAPYTRMTDSSTYQEAFEEGMKKVLTEIFDPAIPFTQTEDASRCITCPYKGICQRH